MSSQPESRRQRSARDQAARYLASRGSPSAASIEAGGVPRADARLRRDPAA